jgi:hypothetical protein
MLSSSQLFTCVKFIMRIKLSTPQDLDDEGAHAVSPPDADTPPVASSSGMTLGEPSNTTGRYAIVGLALFALATMIFMLMGGLRWLRRLIATRHRGRYRKVDDEDPEK